MSINYDQLDARGRSALHHAVINRQHQQMINLLKSGANPNIRDSRRGYTPLWYAVSQNQDPMSVKILKAAKAEVDQNVLAELLRQSKAEPLNRNLRFIREELGLQIPRQRP